MNESNAMISYKNKISEEIAKRKFLQLESMSLSELLIEYNKIKNTIPSEPKVIKDAQVTKKTQWGEGDPGLRTRMSGDMGRKEGESFLNWLGFK